MADIIRQCQCQRQRGLEHLSPGKRAGAPHPSLVHEITYHEIIFLAQLQFQALAGHPVKTLVRRVTEILQVNRRNELHEIIPPEQPLQHLQIRQP